MTLAPHRVARWRTLVAAIFYLVAAASLLAGLWLSQLAAASRARNALTGDFTGAAMTMWAVIAWCVPLALGATLLAMQLRSPPGMRPDGGRMGPDRRLLYGLDRMRRGPRRIFATGLVGLSLAIAALLVLFNRLPFAAGVWTDPSRITAIAVRDWVLINLVFLGPFLLLAIACGSLALRLMRGAPAPEPP